MSVFSTSQNRHFYVAKRYADGTTIKSPCDPSNTAAQAGDMGLKVVDNKLVFTYQGVAGPQVTDRINIKNITYAKAFRAFDMVKPLHSVEVALDSNINSGAPIVGQDYILRILFKEFFALSATSEYLKDAAVHVTAAMDNAKKFFDAMKEALDAAFSRESGATKDSNPYLTFTVSGSGSSAKLIITEKPQSWRRGMQVQNDVKFYVQPTTVYTNGDDVIWGTVTDKTPTLKVVDTDSNNATYGQLIDNSAITVGTNAKGNGESLADLEWFCMGERGDIYRGVTYPDNIETEYLIDPTKEYNVLEIHHAFTDTGVNSYNSEKDITIAVPVGGSGSEYDVINAIIGAFNSATGLSVATLS